MNQRMTLTEAMEIVLLAAQCRSVQEIDREECTSASRAMDLIKEGNRTEQAIDIVREYAENSLDFGMMV